MKHSAESIQRVLSEIGMRIPKALRDALIIEEKIYPTIEMVVEKALEDKDVRPDLKEKLKTLKESGTFSKRRKVVDPTIARLYDQFMQREINKEIKKGRLPGNIKKYVYGQKNSD